MDDKIEVDPNAYADSIYGSESDFSTESLSSSIYDYRYEHGRRYHAYRDGKYALPNDETEQDRLDIVHHIGLLMLDNKLHLSPIGNNPQRILDIGTGTGIWAIDVGELYPSAEVIGTDLSPIQPSWVPPNVRFQIDDAESEWTWPLDHFDFIHIRHMTGAIKDWPALVKKAFKHLNPGGWVELNEYEIWPFCDDGTLTEDMALMKYYHLIHEAIARTGSVFLVEGQVRPILEKAGFKGISERKLRLPLNTWPANKKHKEWGAYALMSCKSGFEAFGMALLTRVLDKSQKEARETIDSAKKQAADRSIHSYGKQFIYYGQKPEAR